jgi:hypothetical protein
MPARVDRSVQAAWLLAVAIEVLDRGLPEEVAVEDRSVGCG